MNLTKSDLDAIKTIVADALAGHASGVAPAPRPAAADPWAPIAPAANLGELDRNACSQGYDDAGYRHRSHYPTENAGQYTGSLEDAFAELKTAKLWQGDYLDFGPDQVGNRFKDWASVTKDQGDQRGLVCRYALATNSIPTSREYLAGFVPPPMAAEFPGMTAADLWAWIGKIRAARTGTPGAGAGGFSETTSPGGAGGGAKG